MDVHYSKEGFRTYMVIEDAGADNTFEEKMLENHDGGPLLRFFRQSINGECRYCYDITGMKNLDEYARQSSVNYNSLRSLLLSLEAAFQELECLLLEPEELLFGSDRIYVENDQLRFACVPGWKENFAEGMKSLSAKLLAAIDYRDKKAVLMAYELHRRVCLQDFTAHMIHDMFAECALEPGNARAGVQPQESGDAAPDGGQAFSGAYGDGGRDTEQVTADAGVPETDPGSCEYCGKGYGSTQVENAVKKPRKQKSHENDAKGQRKVPAVLVLAAVYIVFTALMMQSGILREISQTAGIRVRYLLGGMMGIGAVLLLIVWTHTAQDSPDAEMYGNKKRAVMDNTDGEVSADSVEYTERAVYPDPADGDDILAFQDFSKVLDDAGDQTMMLGGRHDADGETVVLGRGFSGNCLRLVSKDRSRTGDLVISDTPAVIGSRSPQASVIIDLPGVSRSHALLEQDAGRYTIADIGSTNGTYVNGEKLVPDRRYPVSEADIISFGDVSYTVRL